MYNVITKHLSETKKEESMDIDEDDGWTTVGKKRH